MYKKSDGTCACGFFLERGLTWQDAVNQCRSFGARLPEIYSAEDNAKIFSLKVILEKLGFEHEKKLIFPKHTNFLFN